MRKVAVLTLAVWLAAPASAPAEEAAPAKQTYEQWLGALRNSGSYRKGQTEVSKYIDWAYDLGAIEGAKHWKTVRGYYTELARAKGCAKGKNYARGPVKACHRVAGAAPGLLSSGYHEGKKQLDARALESLYAESVRGVLLIIYDYGYVQGMKYGRKAHNDDLTWSHTFFKSCVSRATGSKGEPVCATESKKWAEALLNEIGTQLESHGLPGRSRPQ